MRKRNYFPAMNDLFFGNEFMSALFNDGADYSVPAVNIRETEKSFEIEMALPGINKDEIRIKLEKDLLTVSSERKSENDEKADGYRRREFSFRSFSRSFIMPEMADTDNIKASHENGILKVELPKMKEDKAGKSKTIKIS